MKFDKGTVVFEEDLLTEQDEIIAYLYLDGFVVTICAGGRVVRVPVLVAVGVKEDYHAIIYAASREAAIVAWQRSARKQY